MELRILRLLLACCSAAFALGETSGPRPVFAKSRNADGEVIEMEPDGGVDTFNYYQYQSVYEILEGSVLHQVWDSLQSGIQIAYPMAIMGAVGFVLYMIIQGILQLLGFAFTTKMSILRLIAQIMTESQFDLMSFTPHLGDVQKNLDLFLTDEKFQRGIDDLNLSDLLTGAEKVADAVKKFQSLNEENRR